MTKPDKVFRQAYDWYRGAVTKAVAGLPAAQQAQAEQLLWQMLGLLQSDQPPPDDPDLEAFKDAGGAAESLAVAAQIVAEVLAALELVKKAVDGLQGGNPGAALAVVVPVFQQVQRLSQGVAGSRYPSAFSLGKMLLTLSGDAQVENPAAGQKAEQLARLLGAASAADIDDTQAALGWLALLVGCMIDRSFTAPSADTATAMVVGALPPLPVLPHVVLPFKAPGLPPGAGIDLAFNTSAPIGVQAQLALGFDKSQSIDGQDFVLALKASAGVTSFLPVLPPGRVQVSGDFEFGIDLSRKKEAGALVLGPFHGASLKIGEIGIGLVLKNGAPSLNFFARKGRAQLVPEDAFLKLVLGEGIALDFAIEAQADQFGKLRLKNGSGLRASLPVPTLPTGPFKLQLINLGLEPVGGSFLHLNTELSASFGVDLGPFQAAIDRLGLLVELDFSAGAPSLAFAFKPPSGIGLSLDAGIVQGGGYLYVDPARGEYAGVLELKLMAIGVKAIAILSTKTEAGFSLLLLIYGQFPAIQLSFGFTLTGVGGLIGVQHTVDTQALSRGLGNGSLDAILFPANPVGDAPKIIATLRTLFPVKKGGFVIGPMLELGWGTPSLVTVRMGLLIAPTEGAIVILGQVIVQLPPLVDAGLALLRLQLDFVGSVVLSPLAIAFDAKLRDSRVVFITLTGQFAFRARFGDQPTFLISAGGFHPRFKEVPSDIPAPFERVGAAFDIGIIGVSFKGYFAITSATVQAGSELKVWADLGVASIEGGWGFDAICYLQPRFYFEVDLRAYLEVHVFGMDFAAIRIEGSLAGPGRWRIAGRGVVELPLLPDVDIHIDEAWGTDRNTPVVTIPLAEKLAAEIGAAGNWSAQLPQGGEACVTVAKIEGVAGLLAHPLGTLVFQQKLVPLELRLAKVSGSRIAGANEYFGPALVLSQGAEAEPAGQEVQPRQDFFAAAQFLEMSEADRLAKPSFEAFDAGYALRDSDYAFGAAVAQPLQYEEADLGADEPVRRKLRHRGLASYLEGTQGPMLQFGAAGRSRLRDKALAQPALKAPLAVKPAPVTVADKSSLAPVTAAGVQHSVWQAAQGLAGMTNVAGQQLQVVELAELG
ncbi:hypothetical protein RD110_05700 [Rhodoferax koreense]|uniref:DUF6603 domain-containing protein n=1 Tax=Rhodoferax koreensis TaxID=1842727 RepID=A0A1P8JSL8_9BURK|nr:DUF6603 domain-containing protein [Rhodoferax koreense]APW36747.1 hypothetical protein RD110_05700 [Rhodoferax koreense]